MRLNEVAAIIVDDVIRPGGLKFCDVVRQQGLREVGIRQRALAQVARMTLRAAYMICRALAGSVSLALAFM